VEVVPQVLNVVAGSAAQVASPRQNVEELAPVPLFKFATGKLPVTPPFADEARLIGGMSALASGRKYGSPVAAAIFDTSAA